MKKLFIFIFCLFFGIGSLVAETKTYLVNFFHSGKANVNLTANKLDIIDGIVYYEGTLSYSYDIADDAPSGHKVYGSGRGTISSVGDLSIVCKHDIWVTDHNLIDIFHWFDSSYWSYQDSDTKKIHVVPDNDYPKFNIDTSLLYSIDNKLQIGATDNTGVYGGIEYTIKNSEGSKSGKTYAVNGSIELSAGKNDIVLKVRDYAGHVTTKSFTVYYDEVKPKITFNGDIENKWYQSGSITALVEDNEGGSGVDLSSFKWWTNDDYDLSECKKNTLTFGRTLFLNESGKYNVYFSAADKAGNNRDVNHLIKLDIDNPILNIKDYPKEYVKSPAVVDIVASDAHSGLNTFQVSYNDSPFETLSSSYHSDDNFKFELNLNLEDGKNTLVFKVIDNVKNETITKPITLLIDNSKPVINPELVKRDFNGKIVTDDYAYTAELTISCKDEYSGVDHIELYKTTDTNTILYSTKAEFANINVPGIVFEKSKSSADTMVLSFTDEDDFCLTIKAYDKAGNEACTVLKPFHITKTTPVIELKEITNTNSYSEAEYYTECTISVSCKDLACGIDESSWKYSLTGVNGKFVSFNGKEIILNKTGNYDVVVRVKSKLGIEGQSKIVPVHIDNKKPIINNLTDLSKAAKNIRIKASAQDIDSGIVSYKWNYSSKDENPVSLASSREVVPLLFERDDVVTGENKVTLTVYDGAGNVASYDFVINIDNISPRVEVELEGVGVESNSNICYKELYVKASSVDFDVNEESWETHYTYIKDNEEKVLKGKRAVSLKDNGIVKVWFEVEDNLGNRTVTEKQSYYIDTIAPRIISYLIKDKSSILELKISDYEIFKNEQFGSGFNSDDISWTVVNKKNNQIKTGNGLSVDLFESDTQEVNVVLKDKLGNISTHTLTSKDIGAIDLTGPSISYEILSFAKDKLAINSLEVRDELSKIFLVNYYIDNILVDSNKEIDISKFENGKHKITVEAIDNSINKNASRLEKNFYIDRIKPEIDSVIIYNNGNQINEEDYIFDGDIEVNISSSDFYIDDDKKIERNVSSYYYGISNAEGKNPLAYTKTDTNEFTIKNNKLSNGLNFIYFYTEDSVGNESDKKIFLIAKDNNEPKSPKVSSSTHQDAQDAKDAEMLNTAIFEIRQSSSFGSGIYGYRYSLVKELNGIHSEIEGKNGTVQTSDEYTLIFDNLEDNIDEEFYVLKVWTISGNGKESKESAYRFRVDSTPPSGLRLSIRPQTLSKSWYSSLESIVTWNTPQDMTGVKAYTFEAYVDKETVPCYSTKLAENSITVYVSNLLGERLSGQITYKVTAEDYAGNTTSSSRSYNVDINNPVFKGTDIEIKDTDNINHKIITWPTLIDAESGISSVKISYAELQKNPKDILIDVSENKVNSYELLDLLADTIYSIKVYGYDKAGNHVELEKMYVPEGVSLPASYDEVYSENIKGFNITGTKTVEVTTSYIKEASITVPNDYSIYLKKTGKSSPITSLNLCDIQFNGKFITDARVVFNEDVVVEYNDSIYVTKEILYDHDSGLTLTNVNFAIPVSENKSKNVVVESVNLGFPALPFVTSDVVPFSGKVYTNEGNSFVLNNVENISISGSNIKYGVDNSVYIKTSSNIDLKYVETIDGKIKENKNICLTEIYTDNKFITPVGNLVTDNLILNLEDTIYSIKLGAINGNVVKIYEATVDLPEGYKAIDANNKEYDYLTLKNFVIDNKTGFVTTGADFYSDKISYSIDGKEYLIENGKVSFNTDGKLLVKGSYNSGYNGLLNISNLQLTSKGFNFTDGCDVNDIIETTLFGYNLSIKKANFRSDSIHIKEGTLNVYDTDFKINDLVISSVEKDKVLSEGIGLGTIKNTFNYGKEISIYDIVINSDGVFGKSVFVPVGLETEVVWQFENVLLNTDKSLESVSNKDQILLYGGYTVVSKKASFDGIKITVEEANITNINGFENNTLTLKNIVIDGKDELASGGEISNNVSFTFGGWNSEFSSLTLTKSGLCGRNIVSRENDNEDYLYYLVFDNFSIASDGVISSGEVSSEEMNNIFVKKDYMFEMEHATFRLNNSTYELYSAAPIISISYDDSVLTFKNGIATSDGSFVTEMNEYNKSFVASNLYNAYIENIMFDGSEIRFDGSVGPDGWNAKVKVSHENAVINYDLSIVASAKNEVFKYTYAGWNITGTGVILDEDCFTVESNVITYIPFGRTSNKAVDLNLGVLTYSPEGFIEKEYVKYQGVNVSLISDNSVINETRFNADGLYVSMDVVLPEIFNGYTIDYGSVKLYQDGRCFADFMIPHLGINVGPVNFDFDFISLTEQGLSISDVNVNVPSLENLTISLSDLSISNSGEIELKGACTSPFTLWNMVFCLNDLSIESGVMSMNGTIGLPNELPGILSGRTIGLREFSIDLKTGIPKTLDASLEGDYVIPFLDKWALSLTSVGVGYDASYGPKILLKQAKLIVPSGYGLESLQIDDVVFNPLIPDFDYGKIQGNLNVSTTISGIEFKLTRISITKEMTVGFGGSASFVNPDFPEFIRGKFVNLHKFEITRTGELGDIDIELAGLSGKISPKIDAFVLADGKVRLKKDATGKGIFLSIGGSLVMTNSAPQALQGLSLRLECFEMDLSKPAVTSLIAYNSKEINGVWSKNPAEINYDINLGGTTLNDLFVEVNWDGATEGEITIAGGLCLPDSLPEGIGGTEIRLDVFKIGFDGQIKEFAAEYNLEKTSIGCIDLTKVRLNAKYENKDILYDVGATIVLPEDKFPEGIGGTSTSARFVFTSSSIKSVDANIALSEKAKLFGCLGTKNVNIGLTKTNNSALLFNVTGSVLLPETMPKGLAGMSIDISAFTIDEYGNISNLNIGTSAESTIIYDTLELNNYKIEFKQNKNEKDDFIINIYGNIFLKGEKVPEELKKTSFAIEKFEVSTKHGMQEFSAGLKSGIEFNLLGGLKLGVEQLWFTDTGFKIMVLAGVEFPNMDFGGVMFDAGVSMTYTGELTGFEGGLAALDVTIMGFKGQIEGLYVTKADTAAGFMVALKDCRITLPDNMGSMAGQQVYFSNATFNPDNGDFNGVIGVTEIKTDIVGFTLSLKQPELNIKTGVISFEETALYMPEFMGNASVSLYKVTISAAKGLTLGGGGFTLPDFGVGEVGFKNVGAEFMIDGNEYFISGHGGCTIPGAGTIEAELSFTNIQPKYPIGLKRAFFSYTAYVGGIPLGNTGLCLSGIRGGLAYGEPEEVPEKYRGLFEQNGTRLQLGLTINDQGGGKLVSMKADTWIDVSNVTMLFQGDMTILEGTLDISATSYALIKKGVFATGMDVKIVFVRGHMELYIFDKDGSVKFSGQASIQIGLPKDYLKPKFHVSLPTHDLWLAEGGAKFGDFDNGKRGFLAYVSIHLLCFDLGPVGAFYGTGGLDLDISGYEILKPEGMSISRSARGASIVNLDRQFDTGEGNLYFVNIPGGNKQNSNSVRSRSVSRMNIDEDMFDFSDDMNNDITEDTPVTTCFVLEYDEGDPEFVLVSPSGEEYKAGEIGVTTDYYEGGVIICIDDTEGGKWAIKVKNLEEGTYTLAAIGVNRIPDVVINEPVTGVLAVTNEMYVSGTCSFGNKDIVIYAAESEATPEFELATLHADENGNFSGYVPTENLNDGTYTLIARAITDNGLYSPAAWSTGKYCIDRSAFSMKAPLNVTLTETDEGQLKLRWENANGKRTYGYNLKSIKAYGSGDLETQERVENLGNINELIISNYAANDNVKFALCSYDENGNTSEYTNFVEMTIGAKKTNYNVPVVSNKKIEVVVCKGDVAEGNVSVKYKNWNSDKSYISAELLVEEEKPEEDYKLVDGKKDYKTEKPPVNIKFQKDVIAEKNGNDIAFEVFATATCDVGEYTFNAHVFNENNYESAVEFTIKVIVVNPAPTITGVYPTTIDGTVDSVVQVFGSGFVAGTKFYINETELAVVNDVSNGTGVISLVIPSSVNRGYNNISAVGPSGDTANYSVEVVKPGYDLTLYTSTVVVKPGEKAEYKIKATSFDGYTQDAKFTLSGTVPAYASVELPEVKMDTTDSIIIAVSEDAKDGNFTTMINANNGTKFALRTFVNAEGTAPVITSSGNIKAYTGCDVAVYGYGFGKNGKLFFNNEEIKTTSWNAQEIHFVVPNVEQNGKVALYVQNENGTSSTVYMSVYKVGYTVKAYTDVVKVNAGETKNINVALNGFAENIKLEVNKDPSCPVDVKLSKNNVSTNAVVELAFTVPEKCENGDWNITLMTNCGMMTTSKTFTVKIAGAFEIVSESIPNGTYGVMYKTKLLASEKNVNWRLTGGRLPEGISFTNSGELSGIPSESGDFTAIFTASKSNGTTVSKKFAFTVEDDFWSSVSKDVSRTYSTSSEIPSTSDVQWSYKAKKNIDAVYAKGSRIVVTTKDNIYILSKLGKLQWSTGYGYVDSFIANGYIYGLKNDGTLEARSLNNSAVLWSRNNVESYISNGSVLITKENSVYSRVDIEKGTLIAGEVFGYNDPSKVLWFNNTAYEYSNSDLNVIYGNAESYSADSEILTAAVDANGFVIVTKNSITVLDDDMHEIANVNESFNENVGLAIDKNGIAVCHTGITKEYNRETLELKWLSDGASRIYLGNEKAILITEEGLNIINRYRGNSIWKVSGKYNIAAAYDSKLYASDGNILKCFNGNPNGSTPVTEITLGNAVEGKNGWYVSNPTVNITAEDTETYVTNVLYKGLNGTWTEYEESLVLEDGEYTFSAYALDSRNSMGEVVERNIKVDTKAPVTVAKLSATPDENGWYSENVYVTLSSTDETSGVKNVIVNGKEYNGTFAFTKEGVYEVTWYAEDNAGNIEEKHTLTIKIDYNAPETSSVVKNDTGITVITLNASDTGSGVALIEYSLDGETYQEYKESVVVLDSGKHVFTWRVFDVSGKTSGEQRIVLNIAPNANTGDILALAEMNGKRVDEAYPFTWGSMLYTFDLTWNAQADGVSAQDYDACYTNFWARNCVQILPDYIHNGEYIKWRASDLKDHTNKAINFYVKKNALVYTYVAPNMTMDDTWFLLDDAAHVQDAWYSQGWKLYMKRVGEKQNVSVNVPKECALPIIVVKEEPEIETEMMFERFSAWDDVYYNGRKPFRNGVQIHVDAKVNPIAVEQILPVTRKWSVIMNGVESSLNNLWFDIPLVTEDTELTFRYKIESADGKCESMVEKTIIVSPPDAPEVLYPWYR